MPSRAVSHQDDALVQRVLEQVQGDGDFYGPPLSLTFEAANTRRDVAHGLGVVPDGYSIVFADAELHAVPGVFWTDTLAYLQASADHAHAIIRFRVLRQRPSPA